VCRSFLTAEPKEKYKKIPDFYSFSSIWPLMETSKFDVPILESVTNNASGRMKMQIDIFFTKKIYK
jgi:hypothetical protein